MAWRNCCARSPLKQGDDIGKGFVQSQDSSIAWLIEIRMQPIQQGMGDLMGDNIVQQAGENHPARQSGGWIDVDRPQIPANRSRLQVFPRDAQPHVVDHRRIQAEVQLGSKAITCSVKRAAELRKQTTPAEKKLWAHLRLLGEEGIHFRRHTCLGTV